MAGTAVGLAEGWNGQREVLPAAWLPGHAPRTAEGSAAQGAALGWRGEEDAAGLPGLWLWVCPYCFSVVGRTSLCDHPVPPQHGSLQAPVLFQAWLWMCVSGLRAVKIKCSGLLRGPRSFARFISECPGPLGKVQSPPLLKGMCWGQAAAPCTPLPPPHLPSPDLTPARACLSSTSLQLLPL